MTSKISIKQRIENAHRRDENSLNLSFRISAVYQIMGKLGITENEGTDKLSQAIIDKLL